MQVGGGVFGGFIVQASIGYATFHSGGRTQIMPVYPDKEVGSFRAEDFDPDAGVIGVGGVVGAVPDVTFMEVVGVRVKDNMLEECWPLSEVPWVFNVGYAPCGVIKIRVSLVVFLMLYPREFR